MEASSVRENPAAHGANGVHQIDLAWQPTETNHSKSLARNQAPQRLISYSITADLIVAEVMYG